MRKKEEKKKEKKEEKNSRIQDAGDGEIYWKRCQPLLHNVSIILSRVHSGA
jgi:hypothetical protein